MTSRRYSELSSFSNMSILEEGDENTTPVVDANSTPRAKYVPMKKTRVSDSPLSSIHPQHSAFKGDKNLEETFVEKSFVAAPLSSALSNDAEEPSIKPTQQSAIDKHLEETFVEQSFFHDPLVTATSAQQTPSVKSTQRSVSFAIDKHLEETFVEQSFVAAPFSSGIFNDKEAPNMKSAQQSVSFSWDKEDTFTEQSFSPATPVIATSTHPTATTKSSDQNLSLKGDKNLEETFVEASFFATPKTVQPMTDRKEIPVEPSFFATTSSKSVESWRYEDDTSVFGTSQISFLETEMQIYAEEECKCTRFESVIKEYTVLREKFDTKTANPGKSADSTFKVENKSGASDSMKNDEILRLSHELAKTQMEVENYKKSADIAKKEADDFQFILDQEKQRAKNRISDLQKEVFALHDELEKLGRGDNVMQENSNDIEEQLFQINEQLAKAITENEEYKAKIQEVEKESKDLQAALTEEKNAFASRLADLNIQKDTEIDTLKSYLGDTAALKEELIQLKEKLQNFDDVVQKGHEVESECNKLRADLESLCIEKASECANFEQLKENLVKENAELHDQLSQLNNQLATAKDEVEFHRGANVEFKNACSAAEEEINNFKIKSETAQKEIDRLQNLIAELQSQKDAEIESMKAEMILLEKETTDLNDLCVTKGAEIDQMKDAFDKERLHLQEQFAQMNEQFVKAVAEVEENNAKILFAESEVKDLQAALTEEKNTFSSRLADLNIQKDAEIDALKTSLNESAKMKEELLHLKEKLQNYDIIVQKGHEVEIEYNKLKTELDSLCKEKALKYAEFKQLKENFGKENAQLQGQLLQLNNQLASSNGEIENYKMISENAQKEVGNLQNFITEKDAQIESMKAEMVLLEKEKTELSDFCITKDAEFDQAKDAFAKEKTQLQEQLTQMNEQLAKENEKTEQLKKKIDKLYDDLDASDAERKELSEVVFELSSKLSKYTGGEDGHIVRAAINMADVVSPNNHVASPDNSFKSVTEEPDQMEPSSSTAQAEHTNPSSSINTPKRKQSFGSKIASPFRRHKRDQSKTSSSAAATKDSSCATQ